ncbi:unnamed protein product [Symbiodinium sp. CCMP2456]|nr:unnamed protein product [Symbiodinium sp. CCMP2456]
MTPPGNMINSAADSARSATENRRRQRRQGFPALGISVLESATDAEHGTDLLDIKFRGLEVDRRRSELDLQSATMKGRTKEQAQILAIAHGLQEGIEDLLAGRIFRPGESDEVAVDSSSADSDSSSSPPPTSPKDVKVQEAEKQEVEAADPVKFKKKLAGMPGWMKGEVSEDEDSNSEQGSAPEDLSDDDSVDGFLNINYHDIDDIVQETDHSKIEQQVNAGRAATNRIMYEWKEFARVKLTEQLNNWFQQRMQQGERDVAELDSTEAESFEIMAEQSEGVKGVKSGIEQKDMALFSTISCFQQKFAQRLDEHWESKRKFAEELLARVQQEEEEKQQERLRRQAERAAKKFHDIDDQIADLRDNVEQIKGELQRMELMKQTMPAKTRRSSTGNKAAEVLSIISSQQEEAQVLSGKLALGSQRLESLEDAVEKAKVFFMSAGFKSKKIRIPPADDPAYLLVSEAVVSQMQAVLAQLMLEDEALAESVSLAYSTFNRPGGKKKVRNGMLKLEDTRKDGDQKLSGSESFQQVEEIVVSNDPEQRRLKFKEIEAESTSLREEIAILQSTLEQPILPTRTHAEQEPQASEEPTDEGETQDEGGEDKEAEDAKPSLEQAYRRLLSSAEDTVEIIKQKKGILTSERSKSKSRSTDFANGGEAVTPSASEARNNPQLEEQLKEQQTKAARLSEEEKAMKVQLKRLRAATAQDKSKVQAPDGLSPSRQDSAQGAPTGGDGGDAGEEPEGFLEDGEGPPGESPLSSGELKKRRRRISRLEAAQPDDALRKQLKDNMTAEKELEALRQQLQDLKNSLPPEPSGTGSLSPTRARRNSRVHVSEPSAESAGDASASAASTRSRSRRASSRKSASAGRRSSAKRVDKPAEEPPLSEEQRQENALKLKDLIAGCQKLAEEKEAFEKELASIEDKIRRVKSMDSGNVVAALKKDVQQEKKEADTSEVKELKAEIKKKTSQVNAMRRTWQEMSGSNKRGSTSAAVEEERQREVAKRFAHVLSFLRAAKAAELAKEAENAGLVTESGDAEVVGRSASKFLMSIRKDKMAAQLSENLQAQGAAPVNVGSRRPSVSRTPLASPGTPLASPSPLPSESPMSPELSGGSQQGFSRMMAEARTGHRPSIVGPQHSATSSDDEAPRPSRRVTATTSLQVPRTTEDGEPVRRRSFNNILEKARMRKPREEEVPPGTPGDKANSAVRFG